MQNPIPNDLSLRRTKKLAQRAFSNRLKELAYCQRPVVDKIIRSYKVQIFQDQAEYMFHPFQIDEEHEDKRSAGIREYFKRFSLGSCHPLFHLIQVTYFINLEYYLPVVKFASIIC